MAISRCRLSVIFLIAVFAFGAPLSHVEAGSKSDTRQASTVFSKKLGIKRRDLERSFSSVGEIRCGRHVGTANLIGNNQTIVTAAHVFRYRPREVRRQICRNRKKRAGLKFLKCKGPIEPDMRVEAEIGQRLGMDRWRRDVFYSSGRKRKRPLACRFTHTVYIKGKKRKRTYRIDPESVQFAAMPTTDNAFELMSRDWALARLTKPAKHTTPFAIPSPKDEAIGRRRVLASITDGAVETLDVRVTNASMKFRKRRNARQLYQICGLTVAVRRVRMPGAVFLANCFAEPGSSGSLVVQPSMTGRGYVARGMIVAIDRRGKRKATGKADANKFDFGGTYGIVMEREFARYVRTYIETGKPVLMPVARQTNRPAS